MRTEPIISRLSTIPIAFSKMKLTLSSRPMRRIPARHSLRCVSVSAFSG